MNCELDSSLLGIWLKDGVKSGLDSPGASPGEKRGLRLNFGLGSLFFSLKLGPALERNRKVRCQASIFPRFLKYSVF